MKMAMMHFMSLILLTGFLAISEGKENTKFCLPGFEVPSNESARAGCDSNPCQNGAYCFVNPNDTDAYMCACKEGFGGCNCGTSGEPTSAGCLYFSKGNYMFCACDDGAVGSTCQCFDGVSTVLEKHNGEIQLKDLNIGDQVLVAYPDGSLTYEKVLMFSHRNANIFGQFVQVETGNGKQLKLTPGHLMPIGHEKDHASIKMTPAGDIKVDDIIYGLNSDVTMLQAERVSRVSMVSSVGMYNPHTKSGTIIVGGIYASSYTTAVPYKLAHFLLMPVRVFYAYIKPIISYDIEAGWPLFFNVGM